jgi:uncharacterized membrane protein YfcA
MVSNPLFSAGIGAVLGFLSGIGVGGGSLLVLWLTLIAGVDTHTARCINLMFFIPCALCSSIFRFKQGDIPLKKLIAPILLGAILAGIFSYISTDMDTNLLRKIFGWLMILAGLRELFYRPRFKEFK